MVDFRKLVTVPATKVTRREEFPEFAKRGRGVPELSAWLNAKTMSVYWCGGSFRDRNEEAFRHFETTLDRALGDDRGAKRDLGGA